LTALRIKRKVERLIMRYSIPKISDEELAELAKRIRPVVRKKSRGKRPFYIKVNPDLRGTSYLWDVKYEKEATGLFEFATVTTLHTYGYHAFFKPSVAEVLAQIPPEYRDRVVAFEITERPMSAEDLNKERAALNQGFHVAVTALYTTVDDATLKVLTEKTEEATA
jgi:hypothetical protein